MYSIREATVNDIPALSQLFCETVLTVNRYNYTREEVHDWASCGLDPKRWEELITSLYFVVATGADGDIVGFASIRKDGYLHSMFVHKDFQHRGIATQLYKEMESFAVRHKIKVIRSEVSITARPFFENIGFVVEEIQSRKANKLYLLNYKMKKKV